MPAPKSLRLCASAINPSRLARAGLALVAALAIIAVAACGSTPDDARTPPPTTTPIPTQTPAAPTPPASPTVASLAPATGPAVGLAPIVTAVIATPTPVPRETAPAFDLPAAGGGSVSLSELLEGRKAAVLVFYRGLF